MHLPHDEPEGLSAAEREFVHALRSVAPAPAPLDPFDLAFRAGQRRERADASRRLRVWQAFAAVATLALSASLILNLPSTPAPVTPTLPSSSSQLASDTRSPAHTANLTDTSSPTSAPLLYVPSAASTRTLPAAPTSLVQRIFSIGVQP